MINNDISLLDPGSIVTCNHKEIKKWVEKHGGKPAIFDDPEAEGDPLGIRIDFLGHEDERYMHGAVKTKIVSWNEFFKIFEKRKLAFVYNKEKEREPKDVTLAYKLIPRNSS